LAVPDTVAECAVMVAPSIWSHQGNCCSMFMSVALWIAAKPPPARMYLCAAVRCASLSHTMPEVWSMTTTSNVARAASLKIDESSLLVSSHSFWAANCSNIVMPAGIESCR
jgi:hypothetical protein